MNDISKFQGVIPAFYACYDKDGAVSPDGVRALARYLLGKGVKGLYVGGSSGECIYQSVAERKLVLENVMAEVGGKLTVIAHVACNNTADSRELAAHAESLGVDAIASIPPIYFHLPEKDIAKYWNDISADAPNTDFIIYNIPQLAGVALTLPLLDEMMKNPRVIGVKNSSMPVYDIIQFRSHGAMVFNGPDEQFVSGLLAGAVGGIGGTYAAMPELYMTAREKVLSGDIAAATKLQDVCCKLIEGLCSGQCNMYAMIKEVIRLQGGPDAGDVRPPLAGLTEADKAVAAQCARDIEIAIQTYC